MPAVIVYASLPATGRAGSFTVNVMFAGALTTDAASVTV